MTIKYLDSKRIVATSDFIQGNSGGSGSVNSFYAGGGGGGSFSSGNNALSGGSGYGTGGVGGAGTPSSITGSVVIRAGGGGGGGHYAGAAGGSGGGGAGTNNSGAADGVSATANTGSGGGGCHYNGAHNGGNGGSGIVIIRFTTSGNGYSQGGGTVTTSGSDTIITYTSTSGTTFTPTSTFDVKYLIVAGGAGGGGCLNNTLGSAGGGAGGYRTATGFEVTAQTYTITVGSGGAGGIGKSVSVPTNGSNGGNSTFDSITSIGGGGGGHGGLAGAGSGVVGNTGGSGGGSSRAQSGAAGTNLTPTNVEENSILTEKDTGKRFMFDGVRWKRVRHGFDSTHEALGKVPKQHFVEWFSGKQLPSYWHLTTTGTSSGVMVDEVDGGFKINAWGGANNQYVSLTFNNKRQYAHLGSKFIAVAKANISTNGEAHWFVTGLMNSDYNSNSLGFFAHTSNSNFGFYRSGYTIWSSVPKDSNWHRTEIQSAVASDTMKIDGILEGTSTSYRPAAKLQPMAFAWHGYANGTTADGSIRYMEAYNT